MQEVALWIKENFPTCKAGDVENFFNDQNFNEWLSSRKMATTMTKQFFLLDRLLDFLTA